MEVLTDPRDQYGDGSIDFPLLDEHFSSLREKQGVSINEAAVSHITAYTNAVIVRFTTIKEDNYDENYNPAHYVFQWKPKPSFHAILEHDKKGSTTTWKSKRI